MPTPFFLVCPILRPFSFAWLPLPCLSALALAPPRPANFPTLQLSDFLTSRKAGKLATKPPTPYLPPPDPPHPAAPCLR